MISGTAGSAEEQNMAVWRCYVEGIEPVQTGNRPGK